MRVGTGYDVHRLEAGRALWLGGVEIPSSRGLSGHSDGDVLLHAITDAILGALGEGDLGRHFPSTDASLEGIQSGKLLGRVMERVRGAGFELAHLDTTVIAEAPRLAPHQAAMQHSVAELLGVDDARVNIKVTSTDGLGSIGRGEGIAAQAVVLLQASGAGATQAG